MNYTNIKSISHTVHRCKNMFQKKTLKSKKKHAKIKKKRSKTLIKPLALILTPWLKPNDVGPLNTV